MCTVSKDLNMVLVCNVRARRDSSTLSEQQSKILKKEKAPWGLKNPVSTYSDTKRKTEDEEKTTKTQLVV